MIEYIFFIVLILSMLIIEYNHIPKKVITADMKKQILNTGLIHFTKRKNAERILKEGLVPDKKNAMNIFERNMVWMYINNSEELKQKLDIVHSKGDRRAYDTSLYFLI